MSAYDETVPHMLLYCSALKKERVALKAAAEKFNTYSLMTTDGKLTATWILLFCGLSEFKDYKHTYIPDEFVPVLQGERRQITRAPQRQS